MEALSILGMQWFIFVFIAWLMRRSKSRHMREAEREAEEFMGKSSKNEAAGTPSANKSLL